MWWGIGKLTSGKGGREGVEGSQDQSPTSPQISFTDRGDPLPLSCNDPSGRFPTLSAQIKIDLSPINYFNHAIKRKRQTESAQVDKEIKWKIQRVTR
jgi:hypothetical protein